MERTTQAMQVLHLDDDPEFVEMAAAFLEREDDRLTVETATNMSEAVDRLHTAAFDCIVSDYDLTAQTGLDFLEVVREQSPHLPFILYTGKGSEEVASEAISMGVTDYLQKGSGSELYELLANRITNAVVQHRAQHRATKQERILRLLREVNQALVAATTRAEITTALTEVLAAAEPYSLAWIGEYDPDADRIDPQAAGGIDAATLRAEGVSDVPDGALRTAIRTDELTLATAPAPTLELWDGAAIAYEAAAVVPLIYQGDRYGLLGLYATRTDVFDDPEREMLGELAGDTALALHTAATHRTLRRHQTAVEAVPEGVFILDEDTNIELVNERAAALLDLPVDAVQGRPFPSLVDRGIFDEGIVDWYLEAVRTLLSSESDREEARYEAEIHPVDAPSRLIEVHLALRPYETSFRGTVGIIRDITERKTREQELRQRQAFNDVALDSVLDFYWMLDRDGYVTDWSDTDGAVTGYTPGEAIGMHATDFFPEYEREYIADRVADLRETGETTTEADFRTKGGEIVAYRFDGTVVTDDQGEVERMCGFGQDISARKAHERELERQNERLERFASVVSHDLRNPLSVAKGRIELAQADCDSEHLGRATDAIERSLTLIEDLLQLTREGDQVNEAEPVDLRATVADCWQNVETRDATVRTETTRTVQADPSRLKQLLENLLRNAVEHGGDDVTVTVGPLEDGFYVADDGSGIPEDAHEAVFTAGHSTTDGGTGFGLNIVSEIAAAHDWAIAVTDSADGGARFDITGVTVRD